MNRLLKKLLLGLIVWGVPFVVSVLVWDMENNAPKVGTAWFYALMAFFGTLGFAIGAYYAFKDLPKKDLVRCGWGTGIVWYLELLLLDLLVLVVGFGMSWAEYYPMLITFLNVIPLTVVIGHLMKK